MPWGSNGFVNTITIQRLNAINREFYRVTAREFDQTRGAAWPGWERLLPYLHPPLSVLDVGCGNGRFGLFLREKVISLQSSVFSHQSSVASCQLPVNREETKEGEPDNSELRTRNSEFAPQDSSLIPHPSELPHQDWRLATGNWRLSYHGLDSSPALLERARTALVGLPGLAATFEERDIVDNPPDTGEYDLVALFGVLHHVPGYAQRQDLLRRLAERVKPGGLLVFAAWRFYEYERFRQRIVPWPEDIQVETNDYLLDWRRGQTALRYCHYVDDAEHAALVAATGLREILAYRADGDGDQANRYSLLQRS